MASKTAVTEKTISISPPNLRVVEAEIIGEAPYVQHKFSEKARKAMEATQKAGSTAKTKKKREKRDPQADYEAAKHVSTEGWCGIPAPSIRNACISACRLTSMVMTRAKLSIFVLADGIDADDGTPLIKIQGEPRLHEGTARNDNGSADLRYRPMWETWKAIVRIRYDADQFTETDVINLLMRAGLQVGIGEGRPDSKKSNGLGWGVFRIAGQEDAVAA